MCSPNEHRKQSNLLSARPYDNSEQLHLPNVRRHACAHQMKKEKKPTYLMPDSMYMFTKWKEHNPSCIMLDTMNGLNQINIHREQFI